MAYSQQELWSMSFGGNDTSNEIPHGLPRFLSGLFSGLMKIAFRFEVKNKEVIDAFDGKANGAVVVAPHVSYVDAVGMFLAVRPKQWIRLIGKDSFFGEKRKIFGKILSKVGAFPIKRDSADRTAIKNATRMLKNGELVGIFPEGTRRGKGNKVSSLHGGAALIARMGKAPLIPLGMTNIGLVKQKGKMVRFPKITAIFGQPVSVSSFNFLPKEERLDGCIWYVMRESFALANNLQPEEIRMNEIFPESKDFTEVFREHPIEPVDVASLPTYQEVLAKKKAKEQAKECKQ